MKRNQKQTNANAIVENFSKRFIKTTSGEYSQIKVKNMLDNLLKSGMKHYTMKPLLVLYLTPQIQHEINKNDRVLLKQISNNIEGKYYVLALPAMSDRLMRAEVWYRGKKQQLEIQSILEKAFAYRENVSYAEQVERGIREGIMNF